jgi:hypothetical protein
MSDDASHKDFLLSALRGASLRCKLYEAEITSIGVALKSDAITVTAAMDWLYEAGIHQLICPVPDKVMRDTICSEIGKSLK